ncbi:hypothetical protein [Streptomyces sp. NPDC001315]|uniref:hypothetical protein n=1 Tax=Streptomyces sp. NPDC001315 TaxID=3364562 RepID=UPI0036CE1CCC
MLGALGLATTPPPSEISQSDNRARLALLSTNVALIAGAIGATTAQAEIGGSAAPPRRGLGRGVA